jgi:hypothetical protein
MIQADEMHRHRPEAARGGRPPLQVPQRRRQSGGVDGDRYAHQTQAQEQLGDHGVAARPRDRMR